MPGGNGHSDLLVFKQPPQRVVSLVPSITDSLFDLGMGSHVIGVTDYCRPPVVLPTVGGTRDPDVERIVSLAPDLVIANQEENSRIAVERMQALGLSVWLTFPRSVADAIQVLWTLVELFRMNQAIPRLKTLEMTLEWTKRASEATRRAGVFAPIWMDEHPRAGIWWMTFNRDTYADDVLGCCGGENIFSERNRLYPIEADLGLTAAEPPGQQDVRYPRVRPEEVAALEPEVILVPDEPYPFAPEEVARLMQLMSSTPAVREGRVHTVPGSLITWHGTRLAQALTELPPLLRGSG